MPPVDVGWRDLLRGIIAADLDMVPEDLHGYREALQAEFSAIGIRRVSLNNISGVENYQGLRYPVRLSALGSDPRKCSVSSGKIRGSWTRPAWSAELR